MRLPDRVDRITPATVVKALIDNALVYWRHKGNKTYLTGRIVKQDGEVVHIKQDRYDNHPVMVNRNEIDWLERDVQNELD